MRNEPKESEEVSRHTGRFEQDMVITDNGLLELKEESKHSKRRERERVCFVGLVCFRFLFHEVLSFFHVRFFWLGGNERERVEGDGGSGSGF